MQLERLHSQHVRGSAAQGGAWRALKFSHCRSLSMSVSTLAGSGRPSRPICSWGSGAAQRAHLYLWEASTCPFATCRVHVRGPQPQPCPCCADVPVCPDWPCQLLCKRGTTSQVAMLHL